MRSSITATEPLFPLWPAATLGGVGAFSRRQALQALAGVSALGALSGHRPAGVRAQQSPASAEEVASPFSGGVTTHGQFDYPAGGAPPYPAVLLIAGAGFLDRNETVIDADGTVHQPFARIASELTN